MTVVDGKILFSIEEDKILQTRNKLERARLTAMMLSQNKSSQENQKFKPKRNKHFHCNTIGEEGSELENSH
jgi:hypothetical protein